MQYQPFQHRFPSNCHFSIANCSVRMVASILIQTIPLHRLEKICHVSLSIRFKEFFNIDLIFVGFTVNDKVSVKFYYNLGIEYFKVLQQVYGHGQLMAMIDGEPCVGSNFDPQVNDIDPTNQLVSDIQQMNFESNDIEIQSPTKVISKL